MTTPSQPSLLLRIATLTLAAGTLAGLVLQACISSSGAGASSEPEIKPEPQAAASPSAAAAAAEKPKGNIGPYGVMFPASKAGPIYAPEEPVIPAAVEPAANAAPASARPGALADKPALDPTIDLESGGEFFSASKSGAVFRPKSEPKPAPQTPPINQAPQIPAQTGSNR